MPFNVIQSVQGISVNNVPGAVAATVVNGGAPVSSSEVTPLFYSSYPKNIVDSTTFSGFGVGDKWAGAVQARNGKIYFIPRNSGIVLILDLLAGTISFIAVPGAGTFGGGVLAKNDKIYCIPCTKDYVGIIDTTNDTFDFTTITGLGAGNKWASGCLAENDKIYCSPFDSNSVLAIDTLADTVDMSITGIVGASKTFGCALADNGNIYFCPFTAAYVMIVNPVLNTFDTTTIPTTPIGKPFPFSACCYSPVNNKIYCAPLDSDHALIIDPVANTVDEITISGFVGSSKWGFPNFTPSGKIYCSPVNASSYFIIDPATNTVDTTSIIVAPGILKFWGTITDVITGLVVSVPRQSDYIAIFGSGIPIYNIDFAASAYRNKF